MVGKSGIFPQVESEEVIDSAGFNTAYFWKILYPSEDVVDPDMESDHHTSFVLD